MIKGCIDCAKFDECIRKYGSCEKILKNRLMEIYITGDDGDCFEESSGFDVSAFDDPNFVFCSREDCPNGACSKNLKGCPRDKDVLVEKFECAYWKWITEVC